MTDDQSGHPGDTKHPEHPDTFTALRAAMIPEMPAELQARVEAGEQVWDSQSLREDFEVLAYLAPFVEVRRKATGETGSLMFAHSPRYYFGWEPSA